MRRASTFFLCLLVLPVGLSATASAQGGGKGWIERLSGPGPWEGWYYYQPFACIAERQEEKKEEEEKEEERKKPEDTEEESQRELEKQEAPESNPVERATFGFLQCYDILEYREPIWRFEVEYGRYWSDDDPLVNGTKVDLDRFEFRATTAIPKTAGILEGSFGAGAYIFTGDDYVVRQFTLPVRLAFVPFKTLGKWGSLLQFWGQGTVIAGRVTGEEFGVPESGFDENWEFVFSWGIAIDARGVAH